MRSSLLSVAVALVGLSAALTFGASLDHLLSTPRLYGWNWDAYASDTGENTNGPRALALVDNDPAVAAAALVDSPPIRVGGSNFDSIALIQHKGDIEPIVIDGHAPRAANEIALGAKTLHDAHLHIGSTVRMSVSALERKEASFKVVGTVVIPPSSDTSRLGAGIVLLYDGVKAMVPSDVKLPPVNSLYIALAPGVDKKKELARIERELGDDYTLIRPQQPSDLVNFGQVQNLPLLLAGLVAVLAAATLAHTLVTSIRRRRRDFAILRMLGFAPRQIRGAVAWQATTFVSAALVFGLPVGLALGRLTWTAFAHQLGTVSEPITPSLGLLLTIPGAILLANVIAAIPAVIAGRLKPAPALRAE